ncbi:MAG TPA: hypothetical protein VFN57_15195 [Thermomicrobiaceae bacterium]|nr:hypothetical protein [Thermomicrobiaceae bacterium]
MNARPGLTPRGQYPLPPDVVRTVRRGLVTVSLVALGTLAISTLTGIGLVFGAFVWIIYLGLWLAFAATLLRGPRTLDRVWRLSRALPIALQALTWVLFLPLMLGLWVWARAWPVAVRVVPIAALAAWTVFVLRP